MTLGDRDISNEQISESKRRLNALCKTSFSEAIALKEQHVSIFGCPTKLLEFGNGKVQQVIDNAEHISSFLSPVCWSMLTSGKERKEKKKLQF